jgi:ABC-type branched-subunit amino acid transport system permease subunit
MSPICSWLRRTGIAATALFGLGSYATVPLSVARLQPGSASLPALLFGPGSGLIGYFCVRMSGVAFFMLTLAFSQLLFGAIKGDG